ncbi:nucleotidyltransferase family protein [Nonomuraea purpurea]|uniref:Nucleotidyltransferase family protein n=1 Tax=Nonomuraea purpurea TaxID=1849276 RepID=A0ABV8GRZ3_9ACTN
MRPEVDLILKASAPGADCPPKGGDPAALDWALFLDTAFRHRVAAVVGVAMSQAGWFEQESRCEYVLDALLAAYAANERRNRVLVAEAVRLAGLLRGKGIDVAVRKGAYLTPAVYKDAGLRPMNDIDLFVTRAAAEEVAEALQDEGYQAGRLDSRAEVQPFSRRQSLFWNVHVNNLPPYHRPYGDRCLPAITVDVCFDLFLPASGCDLPAESLLAAASLVEVEGGSVPVLRAEHFLIDVAAHLYKESTTLRYIERGKHQRLLQYVDIAAVVRAHEGLDWDLLVATAERAGAAKHVYFALANAERLYPSTAPASVLADLAHAGDVDERFLIEYGAIDRAQALSWSATDIVERLFSDEKPGAASRSPI